MFFGVKIPPSTGCAMSETAAAQKTTCTFHSGFLIYHDGGKLFKAQSQQSSKGGKGVLVNGDRASVTSGDFLRHVYIKYTFPSSRFPAREKVSLS